MFWGRESKSWRTQTPWWTLHITRYWHWHAGPVSGRNSDRGVDVVSDMDMAMDLDTGMGMDMGSDSGIDAGMRARTGKVPGTGAWRRNGPCAWLWL